jgi:GNAT superfamily N-acetyltransferase
MITLTSHRPTDEVRDRLETLLNEHARSVGHAFANDPVHFEAWEGEVFLGGLSAKVGTDWVFVEFLALTEAARGRGIGRQLIEAIEALARDRGKTGVWLDTYSFQAPDFYRKMGYREVGRIDEYPRGEARHFFAKELGG